MGRIVKKEKGSLLFLFLTLGQCMFGMAIGGALAPTREGAIANTHWQSSGLRPQLTELNEGLCIHLIICQSS
jgi:hypothetical protein